MSEYTIDDALHHDPPCGHEAELAKLREEKKTCEDCGSGTSNAGTDSAGNMAMRNASTREWEAYTRGLEAELARLREALDAALGNLENENVGNAKEWLRNALKETGLRPGETYR